MKIVHKKDNVFVSHNSVEHIYVIHWLILTNKLNVLYQKLNIH